MSTNALPSSQLRGVPASASCAGDETYTIRANYKTKVLIRQVSGKSEAEQVPCLAVVQGPRRFLTRGLR